MTTFPSLAGELIFYLKVNGLFLYFLSVKFFDIWSFKIEKNILSLDGLNITDNRFSNRTNDFYMHYIIKTVRYIIYISYLVLKYPGKLFYMNILTFPSTLLTFGIMNLLIEGDKSCWIISSDKWSYSRRFPGIWWSVFRQRA